MRRNFAAIPVLLVFLLMLLAACAPTTEAPQVTVAQLTEPITYYPFQAGAMWEYLPDRARLSDPTTIMRVEGPTIVDGQVWVAWHLRGRAIDETSYRNVNANGVHLLRVERFGAVITYDPPLRQYPSTNELRVGATWSGDTVVTVSAPGQRETRELDVNYVYTVVDRRTVTLPAGAFDVFVIDMTARMFDDMGGVVDEEKQTVWFSPYVGEVRTHLGHVLIASNVLSAQTAE